MALRFMHKSRRHVVVMVIIATIPPAPSELHVVASLTKDDTAGSGHVAVTRCETGYACTRA